MDQTMTKAKLLHEMRSALAEWNELMDEVGTERMTVPGAAGTWTVKDVMTHLSAYDRWYAQAAEAALRGEMPPRDGSEGMSFEERNQFYHERDKQQTLAEVREESQRVFQRLLAALEQHSEDFLIQPQTFPNVPESIYIWKNLKGDCYGHRREHAEGIRAWLDMQGG